MVASVAVVAVSAAAQTATVTLTDIKGNTVTETYSVGETFTAYTYLNVKGIGNDRIGSLKAEQTYDLEKAAELKKLVVKATRKP